jgi:hypothetical protein
MADGDKTAQQARNVRERRRACRVIPKCMSLRRGKYGEIPPAEMIKYAAISRG